MMLMMMEMVVSSVRGRAVEISVVSRVRRIRMMMNVVVAVVTG